MKKGLLVLALLTGAAMAAADETSEDAYDPVADPKAVVEVGSARFTVLTPALIRMEWSPDGTFEDRASYAFVNRKLPVPKFDARTQAGHLTITTEQLTLRYEGEGARFSENNLAVVLRVGGKQVVWKPGMEDVGNLRGTTRTLDGVSGATPLEPGILSRDGWVLVDDSRQTLFDESPGTDWPWAVPRKNKEAIDWYFFGYGRDYKRALADFTQVAGRIPLPPRFVFGAWWSRFWAYSDQELRELVRQFQAHDVPLDVLVVDMDWHLDGWTGYTWNPDYFPDPEGFLKWATDQGLKVTLNLHPADGVGKHEAAFPQVAKAMGLHPAKIDRVPFDCTDPKYVDAYFKYLHHPLEKLGADFWWIDYQQSRETKTPGLDPLPWLNYLHWTDMARREAETHRRPLIFSRWGGLGNHRYQIGFSGDTFCNWPSLAFQPYFTSTAGNVGFAYWSHDIGGHQPGPVEPELYARWIQYGVFSPALRTHTTKNPAAERRIWEFPPEVFDAARKAFQLRYELIPYIYTMARKCYDTGLPLCRPLYYEWPELDEAYKRGGEYLFGDDMLVAPVTEPADPISGCAMVKVWLPPGVWTNWFTGRTYDGPATVRLVVPLDEIPLFVRGGAIIPTMPKMGYSDEQPVDPLVLNIFPGESGETRIYEDDGWSPGYRGGECAWTPVSHKLVDGERRITIGPSEGDFAGKLKERRYEVRVPEALWHRRLGGVDTGGTPVPQEVSGRALGLFHKMDVVANDEGDLVAEIEIAPTLKIPALDGLKCNVKLSVDPPWQIEGRGDYQFDGMSESKPLIIAVPLASDGDVPQSGLLRANVTVEKDDLKIELPLEKAFLPSINAWWVVGPFDVPFEKALQTPFPPEEKIDLKARYPGKDNKKTRWRKIVREVRPGDNLSDEFFIDFDDVFGGRQYQAVAYALTYLHVPQDMDATLALGTDDGVVVWLNGREIHRFDQEGRAYMSKQDRVPVKLKKGSNALLLKIAQGGGDWGFCVHVETADGKPLPDVTASLEP